jgi:hypothetical protein
MTKDKALKLALEAFEYQAALTGDDSTNEWNYSFKMQDIAAAAIKEALAQPVQPERTWVNLTDEEIDAIEILHWYEGPDLWGLRKFIREIEAKLKEKNT